MRAVTDETGRPTEPSKKLVGWFWGRLATKSADWFILGILWLLAVLVFQPLRERAVAIWDVPNTFSAMNEKITGISEDLMAVSHDVRRLKQPERAFDISAANSGPISGLCVEGSRCTFKFRVHMLEEGVGCRLVPGSREWVFINPRSDTTVTATVVDATPARSLDLGWDEWQVTLQTPYGLEPEAMIVIEALFSNCPGTIAEDAPLPFKSSRDRVQIRPPARR